MNDTQLTPLEAAIVDIIHAQYSAQGFPCSSDVTAVSRQSTGAGRVVKLFSQGRVSCSDGYLDMGGHYIEMTGIRHGLMAVVSIVNSCLGQLEIATYGDFGWDGVERDWRIV